MQRPGSDAGPLCFVSSEPLLDSDLQDCGNGAAGSCGQGPARGRSRYARVCDRVCPSLLARLSMPQASACLGRPGSRRLLELDADPVVVDPLHPRNQHSVAAEIRAGADDKGAPVLGNRIALDGIHFMIHLYLGCGDDHSASCALRTVEGQAKHGARRFHHHQISVTVEVFHPSPSWK